MPTVSEEDKFAKLLIKHLGQMGMNDAMVVNFFMSKSTVFQQRMMDLILAFLTQWRSRYESGYWDDSEELQNLGEMALRMLDSLNGGRHGRGLHHRRAC